MFQSRHAISVHFNNNAHNFKMHISKCCKHLALRGVNEDAGQTRQVQALFSGQHRLDCHTQLSKKAGGEVQLNAEKRKVLTR